VTGKKSSAIAEEARARVNATIDEIAKLLVKSRQEATGFPLTPEEEAAARIFAARLCLREYHNIIHGGQPHAPPPPPVADVKDGDAWAWDP